MQTPNLTLIVEQRDGRQRVTVKVPRGQQQAGIELLRTAQPLFAAIREATSGPVDPANA
jgi:hypothetical protein